MQDRSDHNAPMRTIDDEERQARLVARHHLAARTSSLVAVAGDLVGLHASDPASVYLAAWARVRDVHADQVTAALYESRELVRITGMRRTMFVVPRSDVALLQHGCAAAFVPAQTKRLAGVLENSGTASDGSAWLEDVMRRTLGALEARGDALARELGEDVPELRATITFGEGTSWAGTFGVSTRVLFLLATRGEIVRGRPRGSWLSSQYRWVLTEDWLDGPVRAIAADDARRELISRWLATYGPGTRRDLTWWTGFSWTHVKRALAELDATEIALGDSIGYLPADDAWTPAAPGTHVALLPGLDPTTMGWKERSWYLGEHRAALFDRNGNAGPTVWVDGRIVGGWAQDEAAGVVYELLESVAPAAREALDAEATSLTTWLDGTRVTPRFRTPLEKRLG